MAKSEIFVSVSDFETKDRNVLPEQAYSRIFQHIIIIIIIIDFLLGITKLDKEKSQCIRKKMGAQNIVKEIKQYQKKWLQHVQSMDRNRLPRQALQCRPEGRRNIGRPKKRWRDQLHFED